MTPLQLCNLVALVKAPSSVFLWCLRSLLHQVSHCAPAFYIKVLLPLLGYEFLEGRKVLFSSVSLDGHTQSDCWMVGYPVCCLAEPVPLSREICQPSSASPRFPALDAQYLSCQFLRKASPLQVASLLVSQSRPPGYSLGSRGTMTKWYHTFQKPQKCWRSWKKNYWLTHTKKYRIKNKWLSKQI